MATTLKIKNPTQGKGIQALINRIKNLTENQVESGYFQEQGEHPYAEMSYVELALIHARGEGNFPDRDVRDPTKFEMESSTTINMFGKTLSDYLHNRIPLSQMLNRFGWKISDIAVSKFGIPSQYLQMNSQQWADLKGANSPLVNEGYLMDAWAWKNTYDNLIVEYKSSTAV